MREILRGDILEATPAMVGVDIVFGELRARIVEAEAYAGDPGSHAFRGITPRTKVMFGPPGFAYVYFTYGNHWMLNVTARPEGLPGAILIRAAQPLRGLELMFARREKARRKEDLMSGPGKLAQALQVNKAHYGLDLLDPEGMIRLEPGEQATNILVGRRIGITAGKGDELPWRFMDANALPYVSSPKPRDR